MKTGPDVSISDGFKKLGFVLALAILLVTAAYYFLLYKSDSWVGIQQKNNISTETSEKLKSLRRTAEQKAQNITLFQAVISNNLAKVKLLLDKGADVNAKDKDGKTALMVASTKHIEHDLINLFKAAFSSDNNKAKSLDEEANQLGIMRLLIGRGADVNAKDNNGTTALMLASENFNSKVAELLIGRGADVNAKDNNGTTALMLASDKGSPVAKLLLDNGAISQPKPRLNQSPVFVQAQNNMLDNQLIEAVWENNTNLVKELIRQGANVEARLDEKSDGRTALLVAVQNCCYEAAQLLLQQGANPNATFQTGGSGLHYAAATGDTRMIELLLKYGANPLLKSKSGMTALQEADNAGKEDTSIPPVISKDIKSVSEAAEQGNAEAQCTLGLMYYHGEGTTKDFSETVKWWQKAADQGNAEAQLNLGFMYYKGEGVLRDLAKAATWYRKAAEQGHAGGQTNLGLMYHGGEGVRKNFNEAFEWFKKAAETGSAEAEYNLGELYYRGQGVPRDFSEAAKWYKKAGQAGHPKAQYSLGFLYYQGEGVLNSYSEAAKWYRKAAEQGFAEAQYNLGDLYSNGEGVPREIAQAVEWWLKAAEQKHAEAQRRLRSLYGNKGVPSDFSEVIKLRQAAEQGDTEAQNSLGLRYYNGDGLPKDFSLAAKWYKEAAEKGSVEAKVNLGELYYKGEGVPKDLEQAENWWKWAHIQGSTEAGTRLERMRNMTSADKRSPASSATTFRLVERICVFDSLQSHKDLYVAAASRGSWDELLQLYIAAGRAKMLPAGTKVTLTNRATGMAAEVIVSGLSGRWCIPIKALQDADIAVPPVDPSYMSEQLWGGRQGR